MDFHTNYLNNLAAAGNSDLLKDVLDLLHSWSLALERLHTKAALELGTGTIHGVLEATAYRWCQESLLRIETTIARVPDLSQIDIVAMQEVIGYLKLSATAYLATLPSSLARSAEVRRLIVHFAWRVASFWRRASNDSPTHETLPGRRDSSSTVN